MERVGYSEAARLLSNCAALLDDVEDVPPTTALRLAENLPFDRSLERFKLPFELAKRLLASIGYNLGIGRSNTFVFLLDMNEVFESYVYAALQEHFGTVEKQELVGTLFPKLDKAGIDQIADYRWYDETESWWIGDAKYKHLAREHKKSLRFAEFEQGVTISDSTDSAAGRVLNAADVRQLTVYAELLRLQQKTDEHPNLMLLYPFVGEAAEMLADRTTAWNDSEFWLMPVQVRRVESLRDAITFRVPEESKDFVME
jgi:hypothetical protein